MPMSRQLRSLAIAAVVVAAAFVSAAGQNPAPDLQLKDLTGTNQTLSGLHGKVVLVNFWATWCAPCRKEMPDLVKLQADYAGKGLQIVAVTVDTESFHDKVVAYANDSKLNFPVWFGSTANMAPFDLGVALPSSVLVDQQGRVVATIEGIVDDADIRSKIDGLLGT